MAATLKDALKLVDGNVTVQGSSLSGLNAVFRDVFGSDALTVSSARLGFGQDGLSATLSGTAPFLDDPSLKVMASFTLEDGKVTSQFDFTGSLSLTKLVRQYIPQAVPPSGNLVINALSIGLSPQNAYSFSVTLASAPPWNLDVGFAGLTISDVKLDLSRTLPDQTSGKFSGTITVASDATIDVSYTLPGDFEIRGSLPSVSLAQLIRALANQPLTLPNGFDVSFDDSSVLLQKENDDLTFQFATKVDDFGLAEFVVERAADKWGFAFGLDLGQGAMSALGGLSALKPFEDVFKLDKLLLIVSSLSDAQFDFPDVAAFNNPELGSDSISLPAQSNGLQAGLNFYAAVGLGGSKAFQAVAKFLKIQLDGSVGVVLQVGSDPATNSKLAIDVAAHIQAGITVDGQLGGVLQGGEVGLFLNAELKAKIQGQPVQFDLTLLVVENGVLISGDMIGTIDFEVLKLSNLAVEVGVDFEGVPSLGVAAQLDIPAANFDSSVAVFFDSDDPAKSMVAGAISDLNLKDIVDFLAGSATLPAALEDVFGTIALKGLQAFNVPASLASALDNLGYAQVSAAFQQAGVSIPGSAGQVLLVTIQKGSSWSLTDLTKMHHYLLRTQGESIAVSLEAQLYVAPQTTKIGQLSFPQGFFVAGEIDFLFIKTRVQVDVEPNHGVSADVDIDPIVLHSSKLLAITGAGGKGGPQLSLSTFHQSDKPPALQGPHLLISGELQLLGLVDDSVLVSISSKGASFSIKQSPVPGVSYGLHASFDSLTNMSGGGSADVGLNAEVPLGPLGTVRLDASVGGSFDLGLSGTTVTAKFSGSFEFQNHQFTIGQFDLDINADPLKAHNFQTLLIDKAKQLLLDFLKDADHWLSWIKNDVFTGAARTAQQVGRVLKDEFASTANDIASKTKRILGYTAEQAAQALQGAGVALDDAAVALRQAGYVASDVGEALKSAYSATLDAAAKALKRAGYTAAQVGSALKTAYNASIDAAAKALKDAGFTAEQAASALKGTFTNSVDAAGRALKSAGYAAKETVSALRSQFGATAEQAANVLKDVFGESESEIKSLLKGVGFSVSEIGKVIGKLFPHIKLPHVKHIKLPHVKHIKVPHIKI